MNCYTEASVLSCVIKKRSTLHLHSQVCRGSLKGLKGQNISARDRGNQGTNLMDDRLKLRMDHQMAHPIIEVFPGEAWQETEAYYRKFSCKTCYQKNPQKLTKKTKPKTSVTCKLCKWKLQWTLRCTQSSSGDTQNAELKKGLISKTFQNSLKLRYFWIGIEKLKKGSLLHLVKNTIIWEQMTTCIQNKPDYHSDSRLWLCPMKERWK